MLLLGAVVLVVLVMSVVVFRLLVFSFRWMGLGGGACNFVSDIAFLDTPEDDLLSRNM